MFGHDSRGIAVLRKNNWQPRFQYAVKYQIRMRPKHVIHFLQGKWEKVHHSKAKTRKQWGAHIITDKESGKYNKTTVTDLLLLLLLQMEKHY